MTIAQAKLHFQLSLPCVVVSLKMYGLSLLDNTKKPSMYSSETAYYTTRLLINTLMRFLNGMIYSWTWMTEMANSLDPIQVYLV